MNFSMTQNLKGFKNVLIFGSIIALLVTAGCAKKQQGAMAPQAVEVKAIAVLQQDTPVNYEFVGEVVAKEEVQLRARISGNLVEKMVNGGATVHKGQPLFRIDARSYEANYQSGVAQLAEAEAALSRIRRDVVRYQALAAQQAVAQQVLDNAEAEERQAAARVDAYRAKLNQADLDVQDTVIVSPIDGRIDVTDPSVGMYIQAGQTVLATISSIDPVMVRFSMSENEYLRFSRKEAGTPSEWKQGLKLVLGDGVEYPLEGKIDQVDRGISETGTLAIKAAFANPNKLLMPGMFGRIVVAGEMRKGALLVPERAVQEMLGKTFVTVVGEGDKAESKPVKMGPRVGKFWVVEEGLTPGERVVVEGFNKAQPGASLKVTMIGPDDLKIPERK